MQRSLAMGMHFLLTELLRCETRTIYSRLNLWIFRTKRPRRDPHWLAQTEPPPADAEIRPRKIYMITFRAIMKGDSTSRLPPAELLEVLDAERPDVHMRKVLTPSCRTSWRPPAGPLGVPYQSNRAREELHHDRRLPKGVKAIRTSRHKDELEVPEAQEDRKPSLQPP